jgi:hypothetical protein
MVFKEWIYFVKQNIVYYKIRALYSILLGNTRGYSSLDKTPSEEEEVKELINVLKRISENLLSRYFLISGLIYLGWGIWSILILIAYITIITYNLSWTIYYIILLVSMIITVILVNYKLPQMIRSLIIIRSKPRRTTWKTSKYISLIEISGWFIGFTIMYTLGPLWGLLGLAIGLLIALGTGNLFLYIGLWLRSGRVYVGGIILSVSFYVSAIIIAYVSQYNVIDYWLYSISIIILLYLLFAIYNLLLALKAA